MKRQWRVSLVLGLLAAQAALGGVLALTNEKIPEPVAGLECAVAEDGKSVRIALDSNPSTGYLWSYQLSAQGMLREESQEYIPDEVLEGYVGAGGVQLYVFVPEEGAEGPVFLTFEEARPWEEEVVLAYRVDLVLQKDGTLALEGMSQPPLSLWQGEEEVVPPPQ